tara:strand:+ start:428 stop:1156 length:729 start_codon:yes stop_codon:yes gene_type:complete
MDNIDSSTGEIFKQHPLMRTSAQLNELGKALAVAQSEFPILPKTKTVKVQTHDGKGYTYSYADLALILETILPITSKNGLSVIQIPIISDRGYTLVTRLLHESGEWIESELPLKQQRDGAQAMGSALTYMRRYSLSAMLCLATDEDDDGQIADTDHVGAKPQVQKGGAVKKPDDKKELHKFIDDLLEEARGKDTVLEVEKLWLEGAEKTSALQRLDKKKFDDAVEELKSIREVINQDENGEK